MRRLRQADNRKLWKQNGLTFKEVIFVVAAIGLIAAIAIPHLRTIAQRAPQYRARADTVSLACAINRYAGHTGLRPAVLADLTAEVTDSRGQPAGPFLSAIPSPPAGWTGYTYSAKMEGTYTITSAGDGHTVIGTGTDVTVFRRDGPTENDVLPLRCGPTAVAPLFELVG